MMTAWLQGPMFRLNIVVMSSLAFLAYGLRTPSGPIEVLQLPVAAMQVYFIVAMLVQVGWRGFVEPLSKMQLGLIGALLVYIPLVSLSSPIPSAHILFFSWMIHILFFIALIAFFRKEGLGEVDIVWLALSLTASIHVCAFMIAWIVWPEEIIQMNVPAVGHMRHLGYFLTPIVTAMAVHFVTRQERAVPSLAFFAVTAFYIIYTGQRGGAVAVISGLLAAAAYAAWRRQRIETGRGFLLLVVMAALVAISELIPSIPDWPPISSRNLDLASQTESQLLTGRNTIWSLGLKALQENWIWGYGPGLLNEIPYQRLKEYQPHNVVLQLLLHWGTFGSLIILMTVISFGSNICTALQRRACLSVLPFSVLVTIGVHGMVSGNLFYPFSIVIAIIAFVTLDAIGRQRDDSQWDGGQLCAGS